LHKKKLAALVAKYGDHYVTYDDPPQGRRLLNLENYAYSEDGIQAVVAITLFVKGSTRAQHFAYADKVMSKRFKRKFRRSDNARWSATVTGPGTWHHELLTASKKIKKMSFVPRDLHQQLGHAGGFSYLFK
jgi:hypothetical protein